MRSPEAGGGGYDVEALVSTHGVVDADRCQRPGLVAVGQPDRDPRVELLHRRRGGVSMHVLPLEWRQRWSFHFKFRKRTDCGLNLKIAGSTPGRNAKPGHISEGRRASGGTRKQRKSVGLGATNRSEGGARALRVCGGLEGGEGGTADVGAERRGDRERSWELKWGVPIALRNSSV